MHDVVLAAGDVCENGWDKLTTGTGFNDLFGFRIDLGMSSATEASYQVAAVVLSVQLQQWS